MTEEVVIEIEGEVEPVVAAKPAVVGKRIEKKIKDLNKEESERIIADIKAGLIYDNVDIKTFKNGSARLINKKGVAVADKNVVKEEPTEVKEVKQKKTVLSDTQYLMSELLKMQEVMVTEKNKRKKLKKRFTELDELLNIVEDIDVEKPLEKIPEIVEEKVEEVVEEIPKEKPQTIPPRPPTRRDLNWRQKLIAMKQK